MADGVGIGIPGVHLDSRDHVCAFSFATADKVLIPFLLLPGGLVLESHDLTPDEFRATRS